MAQRTPRSKLPRGHCRKYALAGRTSYPGQVLQGHVNVPAEAFRVLKPGGRFAVSDVVVRGEIPFEIRRNVELWIGCLSGALEESDYLARLKRAGFTDVSIEPTRVYRAEDARGFLSGRGFDVDTIAPLVDGRFFSGLIRARKPVPVPQPA